MRITDKATAARNDHTRHEDNIPTKDYNDKLSTTKSTEDFNDLGSGTFKIDLLNQPVTTDPSMPTIVEEINLEARHTHILGLEDGSPDPMIHIAGPLEVGKVHLPEADEEFVIPSTSQQHTTEKIAANLVSSQAMLLPLEKVQARSSKSCFFQPTVTLSL